MEQKSRIGGTFVDPADSETPDSNPDTENKASESGTHDTDQAHDQTDGIDESK